MNSDASLNSESSSRNNGGGTAARVLRRLREHWRPLVLASLLFKILAFVLLTPIVSLAFRWFVSVSGRTVLADTDILFFFVRPIGWACFIAVGGLWLAVMALEQSAMLHILRRRSRVHRRPVLASLQFAVRQGPGVLLVTARIAAYTLGATAPFLAIAGMIYAGLLRRYDINYYLAEKPFVFWLAVGCGVVLLGGWLATLLRLLSGWLFALPLVLFAGQRGRKSLLRSQELAAKSRLRLIGWLAAWAVVGGGISAAGSIAIRQIGQSLAPRASGSLTLLLFAVGVIVSVWVLFHLIVNVVSTISFASLLATLYDEHARETAAFPLERPAANPPGGQAFSITRARLLVGLGVGVLAAVGVGFAVFSTIPLGSDTQITAHRGGAASAPENTLAAIQIAIEQGADWVEIDVQETADGQVVVFHDSDFKRLAGNPLKIWDATSEDLQAIDIGSSFSADFKNERVPSLDQVLETCKHRVGVNIELKYYGHDQHLEQRVIELVEAHQMEAEIVLMSLKLSAVQKMKQLRPSWRVGLLSAVALGNLEQVDADFLAVSVGIASSQLIRDAHAAGKQVHVWTTNDPVTMSIMIGRGADNLITDETALARKIIEARHDLGAGERLLLGTAEILGIPLKFADQ